MQEIKETSYRQQLKSKILETAIQAFAQRGIKAVKMDDVAQSLSISKRTLYEIYEDKEELLYQGVTKYDRQRKEALRAYGECHDVMEVILYAYRCKVEESREVCPQFYVDIQKYPRIVAYLDEQHQESRQNFRMFLQRGVDEGYFRRDINYDMLPNLFEALQEHIVQKHLFQQYEFRELFATLLLVPLRGICTEKGLKVLEKAEF